MTLLNADLRIKTEKVLNAIQSIPALRHVPVLERTQCDADPALAACLKREMLGLDETTCARIRSELFALGPVDQFTLDDTITEVLILSPENIWLERDGRLQPAEDRFLSELTYRNFLSRLTRETKSRTDYDMPFGDGRLKDFRVHIVAEPIVQGPAQVSLRRLRSTPWTMQQLAELEWADEHGFECLRHLVESKQNIIYIGGTGSGKTSALGACLREIDQNERVLVLEDTDELPLPTPSSTKLLSKKARNSTDTEWGLSELLRQALRMRPDRIVMGEVRGPEAKDLLMAFATGHRGCFGTLHADSPREALLRLEMLVQMGAPQWNSATVRSLIHSSVDAIVCVRKGEDGKRRLDSINRVASLEDCGFCFSALYARTSRKLPKG